MKISYLMLAAGLFCAAMAGAKELAPTKDKTPAIVASDDASASAYATGWKETGGSAGFGDWKFQEIHDPGDAFAGHFVADVSANPEIAPIAAGGKAFGLYANGPSFETAVAFRPFNSPLAAGRSFSFQMLNKVIEQKGASDSPAAGSVGLSLRNGNAADSPDDYNKGGRFELINLKGQANYQVYDGEAAHDTGVPYSEGGVSVTVTLTGADTYDLEITRLADKKTTKLNGRKLGGAGPIESFCIFDRNGEKADAFFDNFQVRDSTK